MTTLALPHVSCRDLSVSAAGQPILDGVSLEFRGPGLVGILGPNGAGKSTLLRALSGYLRTGADRVHWNDRPVDQWSDAERAAFCGYMPQQFAPAWDYTGLDILTLGAMRLTAVRDRPARVLSARDLVAEHGLAPLAARRWSRLSGGERARFMLVATIAAEPDLVLADEPGASLDIRHRIDLLQRLKALAVRSLVIVVMHDLDLAMRFCQRVILMNQGQVFSDSSPERLIASDDLARVFGVRLQQTRREAGYDQVLGVN